MQGTQQEKDLSFCLSIWNISESRLWRPAPLSLNGLTRFACIIRRRYCRRIESARFRLISLPARPDTDTATWDGKSWTKYSLTYLRRKKPCTAHFVSGTHALATVLCALLQHGDTMISLIGAPYDTMQSVIGYAHETPHSLKEKGVIYDEVPLKDNAYDLDGIREKVGAAQPKLVLIQRSRGYSTRASLKISDIREIIQTVKAVSPQTICFVDNCYGEFAAEEEPIEAGADIIAGSLIKNPGGGIAPTGGYIAGREDLVSAAADYLTAPGLGDELGSYAAGYRLFFQAFSWRLM